MALTPLQPVRPNRGGTITRGGVTRQYAPSAGQNTDPSRAGSGGSITYGGVTRSYAPTPAGPRTFDPNRGGSGGTIRTSSGLTRVVPPSPGVTPRTPRQQGPSAAAMKFLEDGIDPQIAEPAPYVPGQFGARSTRPPQQTERANPLSGDNNIPAEGSTSGLRSPFNMRGNSTPQGQDETIGGSMQGTFDRLRQSSFSPRSLFQPRQQQNGPMSMLRRAFPGSV